MADAPPGYLRANYGSCKLGSGDCKCLKSPFGWAGGSCSNWQSAGVDSPEALAKWQREQYEQHR